MKDDLIETQDECAYDSRSCDHKCDGCDLGPKESLAEEIETYLCEVLDLLDFLKSCEEEENKEAKLREAIIEYLDTDEEDEATLEEVRKQFQCD